MKPSLEALNELSVKETSSQLFHFSFPSNFISSNVLNFEISSCFVLRLKQYCLEFLHYNLLCVMTRDGSDQWQSSNPRSRVGKFTDHLRLKDSSRSLSCLVRWSQVKNIYFKIPRNYVVSISSKNVGLLAFVPLRICYSGGLVTYTHKSSRVYPRAPHHPPPRSQDPSYNLKSKRFRIHYIQEEKHDSSNFEINI